jgi:hypothetical protein
MVDKIRDILKLFLVAKLRVHHMLYRLPAISEFLEELIAETLKDNGLDNDWQPNRSHTVSKDLSLATGQSFSIKSGVYDPKHGTLKFSGSRLGKHGSLEAMVESITSTHADYYICLAKAEEDWKVIPGKQDEKVYYLFVFESSKLDYSGEWGIRESKKGGFKYVYDVPGLHAKISPSMSHQLWTTVDKSLIGEPERIVI